MIKNVFGVFAGFIGGSLILYWFRILSAKFFPLPENVDSQDWDALMEFHANLPTNAYLLESFSFIGASFLAAFIASKIAQTQKFNLGLLAGLILSVSIVFILFNIPSPMWIVIFDLIGILIAVLVGSRIGAGGVPDYDL